MQEPQGNSNGFDSYPQDQAPAAPPVPPGPMGAPATPGAPAAPGSPAAQGNYYAPAAQGNYGAPAAQGNYGAPGAQGNYGGTPGNYGAPGTPVVPKRPKQVDSSFGLQIFALVMTVVAIPVNLFAFYSTVNATGSQADGATVTAGAVLLVILGVVCLAANVLTAVFVRKGYNWARIALAVYALLHVVSLVAGANLLGWWGILALVVAAVMLFVPPVPEYFTMMKRYRLQQKAGMAP